MYKTIKIPKEAYEEAKILSKELEDSRAISGVFRVNLSTAISYAIENMLEILRRKKKFLSAAGAWKDMKNIENLKKEIYKNRGVFKREDFSL